MKAVDILLLAILVPAIGWALWHTIQGFRKGNLCSGSCEGCFSSGDCQKRASRRETKQNRREMKDQVDSKR